MFILAKCTKLVQPADVYYFHSYKNVVVYNKENLERQETNKYGRGTEQHLPKNDESAVRQP